MMVAGLRARAHCFALGLVLAAGCGGAEEREAAVAEAAVAEAAAAEAAAAEEAGAEEGAAAEGMAAGEGRQGEAVSETEAEPATAEVATTGVEEPELRTYRFLLVNPGADDAVIHASAGAASVVLDTVRGRDSARVNVEVRSDRLLLEASDARGRPLGSEEVQPSADELSRWVVPAAGR